MSVFCPELGNEEESFWEALHSLREADVPEALWGYVEMLQYGEAVSVPKERSEAVLSVLKALPGWETSDAPKYASHPIKVMED